MFFTDWSTFYNGDWFMSKVEMLLDFMRDIPALAIAFLALYAVWAVILVFAGKKVLPVIKFFMFLSVGFSLGFVAVQYIFPSTEELGCIIGGACIGLLLAIFSKYLYAFFFKFLLTFALGFFGTLALCLYVPDIKSALAGNEVLPWLIAVGGGILVFLLLLLIFKYLEMFFTAFSGATMISVILAAFGLYEAFPIYNIPVTLPDEVLSQVPGLAAEGLYIAVTDIIVTALLLLIGFIVQIKTRRRY